MLVLAVQISLDWNFLLFSETVPHGYLFLVFMTPPHSIGYLPKDLPLPASFCGIGGSVSIVDILCRKTDIVTFYLYKYPLGSEGGTSYCERKSLMNFLSVDPDCFL
jgi:hypothetical protein